MRIERLRLERSEPLRGDLRVCCCFWPVAICPVLGKNSRLAIQLPSSREREKWMTDK